MTVYVFADDDEPSWEPLERVLRLGITVPGCRPPTVGDFMYMCRLVAQGEPDLHLYKHIDSRMYLNLDDAGHAYEFLGCVGEDGSRYRPWRDLRSAIEHLELDWALKAD